MSEIHLYILYVHMRDDKEDDADDDPKVILFLFIPLRRICCKVSEQITRSYHDWHIYQLSHFFHTINIIMSFDSFIICTTGPNGINLMIAIPQWLYP